MNILAPLALAMLAGWCLHGFVDAIDRIPDVEFSADPEMLATLERIS